MRRRLSLIPEWRQAWRFASVQAATVLTVLSMVQAEVLPLVQPVFSDRAWPFVSGGLAFAIVLLRLIAQQQPASSGKGAK